MSQVVIDKLILHRSLHILVPTALHFDDRFNAVEMFTASPSDRVNVYVDRRSLDRARSDKFRARARATTPRAFKSSSNAPLM